MNNILTKSSGTKRCAEESQQWICAVMILILVGIYGRVFDSGLISDWGVGKIAEASDIGMRQSALD